jgi:hypothetical protein
LDHSVKSELAQPDQRLGRVLRVRVPLIRVQRFVAKEVESVPVKSLVPLRVAIEIDAPLFRPSSGVALLVVTLYSAVLSGVMR